MKHVTTEVEYDAEVEMWLVTVYVDGHWNMEHWFHTESIARHWAKRMEVEYGQRLLDA
jgi:hypothetical protein